MTTTTTAVEVLRRIQNDHENIKNDAPQRFPEAATDGDCFRQGDVNIFWRDELPSDVTVVKKPNLQLAPGTTKGSRHCLDSLVGVTVYERINGDALQGPLLLLERDRTITHPEHGDVICPPGVYEITYQRAMADELRRVRD